MKLKPLGKRAHNIMFHTHTVSGIVISFALFIIFYAGAIALFKDEIYKWENPTARFKTPKDIDYNKVHDVIEEAYANFKPEAQTTIIFPDENIPFVKVFGAETETDSTVTRFSAYVNPNTYEVTKFDTPLTTVGDTIYHLHYLRQIPSLGIWISGFVSVFFLFAIVTGILVHWKNMVNKFYAFTTKGKWKQIWTNAHTVLGIIGLPFQVVYAVTGALFGLLTLLLAPSAVVLFDGDNAPIFESIRPERALKYDENAANSENKSINTLLDDVTAKYADFIPQNVVLNNFGKADATATFLVDDKQGIIGDGVFVYKMKTGKLFKQIVPNEKTYSQTIYNLLTKLHFATFGGIFLKVVYFILAMITCFVIVSGILIWQKARDNSQYTDKQKRFHHKTTKVYLAICLSLFPATALLFLANKMIAIETEERAFIVNCIFFLGWLVFALVGLFWNNYRKLNRNYLLLGGILAVLIPVFNGIFTGDWLWHTIANKQFQVASVDIVWLFVGITGVLMFPVLSKK